MNPLIRSHADDKAQTSSAERAVVRRFGRFELRRLLAKSERSMVWLAHDPRIGQDVTLTLPRVQLSHPAELEAWQREVVRAARLSHPNLAASSDSGVQDNWPYLAVDRAYGLTLPEWLAEHPAAPIADLVGWICQALEGLAFAHEAGAVHGDLQVHSFLLSEQGTLRLTGFATGSDPSGRQPAVAPLNAVVDTDELRVRRTLAERDVLAVGLIAYRLFSGLVPLDSDDVSSVITRLPPHGREVVRLPWTTARPVPEALRAIVNRATAAHERQRYLSARTLLRALSNWLQVERNEGGDPLVLLVDRMRATGHLPAMPGAMQRIARIFGAGHQRNDELAQQVMQDMALSFELLRQVNATLSRGLDGPVDAAVITVRRAVGLLGIEGIRRASQKLRPWPGALASRAAAQLQRLIAQVQMAEHVAHALRPAGYDVEVLSLVVMWQNLGRLLIAYHFPDEAQQISLLVRRPVSPTAADAAPMSESQASLAVLGVDREAVGMAVARHWGLGDEVQAMMRRCPSDRPVLAPDDDGGMLRTVASAANEVVDAADLLDAARLGAALAAIAKRYSRALGVDQKALKDALHQAQVQSGEAREALAETEEAG